MKTLILGDSLEALIDHRGKTPKKLGAHFTSAGVPVASAILIADGVLNLDGARYVGEDTFRKWMPTPTRAGDVLLTSEAPLGRVARVPSNASLVLGQRLYGLRGRPGVLDSGYLFFALQTDRVQADLVGRSTGTTVFGIRQSALRQIRIEAPNFDEQRAIAEVLGALDDKIAANTKLNQTTAQLSAALVAERTPCVPLSGIVHHRRTSLAPDRFGDVPLAHFSFPAFDAGQVPEMTSPGAIKSSKFLIEQPCVLVSKLNPRFPRIWNVSAVPSELALASTEFLVLEGVSTSSSVLHAILSHPKFSASLKSMVAGTSGSHQRVRPDELLSTLVIDPREIGMDTQRLLTDLGALAAETRRESDLLANLRDALLPQLMSGNIRVKDVENTVGEVL